MNLKSIIAITLLLAGAASADFVTHENVKGKYYEVHRNRDGSHTFYLIPSQGHTGGQLGTFIAMKGDKIVFMAQAITNHAIMSWAEREGKVHANSRAFCVTIDLERVDKATLIWSIVGPPEAVSGTTWTTDLLWLLKEAHKDGRFKDWTTKANKSRLDNPLPRPESEIEP